MPLSDIVRKRTLLTAVNAVSTVAEHVPVEEETVEEVVNATEVVAEKAVELTEEIENLSDEMEAKY